MANKLIAVELRSLEQFRSFSEYRRVIWNTFPETDSDGA